MKHNPISHVAAALAILSVSLFSCDDMESHNIPLLDTAKVMVDMNMTEEAAEAPVSTVRIRVTGPDFSIFEKEFPAAGVITLHLKPGINRFEITAFVRPGSPNIVSRFRGTAVANISARSTSSVRVPMEVDETKLVIPDYFQSRIVMMDSIKGGNIRTRTGTEIIGTTSFSPYDIDFDAQGRIYIANSYSSTTGGVYRMDTIDSTIAAGTCVQVVPDTFGVRSIAIDRKRNKLYYTDYSTPYQIHVYDLDTGTNNALADTQTGTYFINAVSVDEATGYIYYTFGQSFSGFYNCYILCYNLNTELPDFVYTTSTITSTSPDPFISISDLIVKNGFLYGACATTDRVAQLPLILTTPASPVYLMGKPGGTDLFRGPQEFIAVTNRKLYIIDETGNGDVDDRIISFDDISGSGWDTFANTDRFFWFYSHC